MISTEFQAGDRVVYTRMERPRNTEWLATYVRAQETAGRPMHVIALDSAPKPRQVGWKSVRRA